MSAPPLLRFKISSIFNRIWIFKGIHEKSKISKLFLDSFEIILIWIELSKAFISHFGNFTIIIGADTARDFINPTRTIVPMNYDMFKLTPSNDTQQHLCST